MSQNRWSSWTQARILMGRRGSSLPTEKYLEILEAQALARDSLWREWDTQPLQKYLNSLKVPHVLAKTKVHDRAQYLMRPDLGRQIDENSGEILKNWQDSFDHELVFCVSDGLATDAVQNHLIPFLDIFLPQLYQEAFYQKKPYPFVLMPFSRVAAADGVAQSLGSRLAVIFVGERPGLSSFDSMGIYLTYAPKIGTPDSLRNCISNIRMPNGLSYEAGSQQLLYLIRSSLRLGISGVTLKLDLQLDTREDQLLLAIKK